MERTCSLCAAYLWLWPGFLPAVAQPGSIVRCPLCNPAPLSPDNAIYTEDTWDAFLAAMHRGQVLQIDEQLYDYFLEVLPPLFLGRRVTLLDGSLQWADFGFAEGAEIVTAFWRKRTGEATQYFCGATNRVSRGS